MTVKTATLCKKLFFFFQSLKIKKKEAGTEFILISQWRNMIQQFMKPHLVRLIMILHSGRIQKYLI